MIAACLISSFVKQKSFKQHKPEPGPIIFLNRHDVVCFTDVDLCRIRIVQPQQKKAKIHMRIQIISWF